MFPAAFLSLSICGFARVDYFSNNLWAEARFYLWAEKDSPSTHSFSIRPPDMGGRGELILIFVASQSFGPFITEGALLTFLLHRLRRPTRQATPLLRQEPRTDWAEHGISAR
jgi:hypothetical protein